jgi:hypothetical protein
MQHMLKLQVTGLFPFSNFTDRDEKVDGSRLLCTTVVYSCFVRVTLSSALARAGSSQTLLGV